jgi:hypothetical protein
MIPQQEAPVACRREAVLCHFGEAAAPKAIRLREPVEHHLTILRDIADRRHVSRADLTAALFG